MGWVGQDCRQWPPSAEGAGVIKLIDPTGGGVEVGYWSSVVADWFFENESDSLPPGGFVRNAVVVSRSTVPSVAATSRLPSAPPSAHMLQSEHGGIPTIVTIITGLLPATNRFVDCNFASYNSQDVPEGTLFFSKPAFFWPEGWWALGPVLKRVEFEKKIKTEKVEIDFFKKMFCCG